MFEKLKNKWEIESNWRFVKIMLVFAITGSSTLFIRRPIWAYFHIDEWHFLARAITWLLIILPAYQMLILFWGFIFGEFTFFYNFFKKSWGRLLPTKLK